MILSSSLYNRLRLRLKSHSRNNCKKELTMYPPQLPTAAARSSLTKKPRFFNRRSRHRWLFISAAKFQTNKYSIPYMYRPHVDCFCFLSPPMHEIYFPQGIKKENWLNFNFKYTSLNWESKEQLNIVISRDIEDIYIFWWDSNHLY